MAEADPDRKFFEAARSGDFKVLMQLLPDHSVNINRVFPVGGSQYITAFQILCDARFMRDAGDAFCRAVLLRAVGTDIVRTFLTHVQLPAWRRLALALKLLLGKRKLTRRAQELAAWRIRRHSHADAALLECALHKLLYGRTKFRWKFGFRHPVKRQIF